MATHILGRNRRPVEESAARRPRKAGGVHLKCTVCNHRERVLIETQLANGGSSYRGLAKQFGLDRNAIYRHLQDHMSEERLTRLRLIAPLSRADVLADLSAEAGKSALENLRAIHQGVVSRWLNALESHSDQYFIALTAQARQNIELLAKLSKELQPAQTNINVGVQANLSAFERPEYIDAIATIVAVLQKYPEARAEVAEALHSLEIARGGGRLALAGGPLIEGKAKPV